MKKSFNTVEEEFLRYGTDQGEYGKKEKKEKSGSSFGKLISFLVVAILAIILAVVAKVGYMLWSNPQSIANIAGKEDKSTQQKVALTSKGQNSQPQPQTQQVQEQNAQQSQPQVQSQSVQTQQAERQSSSSQTEQVAKEEGQDLGAQLASAIATQQEKVEQQAAEREPDVKEGVAADEKELSDEELVKLLLNLEPDQLKRLDIEKILKSKKQQQDNVAKTAYLNNQAIIETKRSSGDDEMAQVSTQVENLVAMVEQKSQKESTSQQKEYMKSLQSEIETRQKTMRFYVVKKGDTLSKIAREIYGKESDYIKIYKANQDIITNPSLIFPGQRLRIPEI